MQILSRHCRAAVTAAMLAVLPLGLHAAPSAESVCADVAAKAGRTIWNSVRETGDELYCRKSWVAAKVDEFAGCMHWTLANNLGNKLKNRWNREFDKAGAEWATWGPRGLGPEPERGTIRGGFKRTFFGPALAYTRTTAEVIKRGGRAEATITACLIDYHGNAVAADQRSFANGPDNVGIARSFRFDGKDSYVLGLVVDTPASVNNFEYEVKLSQVPLRNDIGPVPGIADLHVHQFMNLAMGGRMYWGSATGDLDRAVGREQMSDTITSNPSLDELVSKFVRAGSHVDANRLMKIMKNGTDDEGRFVLGTGGAPSFEDWPNHKDRSHQQVHVSWLKAAHERGRKDGTALNLMVVSLVNNNILCSAFKAVDQYGNVPRFGADGKIAGWESATFGCSDHENVMRQIEAVHDMEREHPWYRVAMTPWHARQIIDEGGLAVVLSLETDKVLSSEGNNYGNWKQQLDAYRALGVTTLQIVHESDGKFAGAALHRNDMEKLQMVHWPVESIGNLLRAGNTFDVDERGYNRLGLTEEGEELVAALVARNMPIDIAHASVRAKRQIFQRVPARYGLYESHTKFERLIDPRFHPRNFGAHVIGREQELVVAEDLLPDYVSRQVLLGLRPSSIDVYDAPNSKVANDCPGSASSFAQQVQYATDKKLPIAFGVDWNTGVSHLGPRFGKGRCWAASDEVDADFRTTRPVGREGKLPERARTFQEIAGRNYYFDGLAHIGMLPELAVDLIENLQAPGARQLTQGAEAYLAMWERAYAVADAGPAAGASDAAPANLPLGTGCTGDGQCKSGRCSSVAGARGVCVCDADGDCPAGNYCNAGLDVKRNACEPKRADGEACPVTGGDRLCQSGQCQAGRCVTPASKQIGEACWVGAECRAGKCNNAIDGTKGTCVCSRDADCGSGQWCDGGADLKKNVCRNKLRTGEVCGTVGELSVGHRCLSGDCKIKGVSKNLVCK